jgi:Helicase conserved C-terminal domain
MPSIVEIPIDLTPTGYETFIKCKTLPKYEVRGNMVITDDASYSHVFGDNKINSIKCKTDPSMLFDYQKEIVERALHYKRYAALLDCGLGKTRIELSWADSISERVLYTCPLAVMGDIMDEAKAMNIGISNIRNGKWDEKIGLINFESMREIDMSKAKGIIVDESSILKNGDGAIRNYLTDMAAGCEYRLCASATPSPNDQSEYATHSVFLGYSATLKEFYSRFFRKEGTDWMLKPHAVDPFYKHLSSWACYIKSPSKLGFQQGGELDHEPNYIPVEANDPGYMPEGMLFGASVSLSDASKVFGAFRSDTDTDRFAKAVNIIKGKRAVIWCSRNSEEDAFREATGAQAINGSTPEEKRIEILSAFRTGQINQIISKPKVLGFGVNIPQAECHLYSGYDFSFEKFYQAVRRSHRYGRKGILDVYIPMAECEKPIWETLSGKLKTFENDCLELQNRFFEAKPI